MLQTNSSSDREKRPDKISSSAGFWIHLNVNTKHVSLCSCLIEHKPNQKQFQWSNETLKWSSDGYLKPARNDRGLCKHPTYWEFQSNKHSIVQCVQLSSSTWKTVCCLVPRGNQDQWTVGFLINVSKPNGVCQMVYQDRRRVGVVCVSHTQIMVEWVCVALSSAKQNQTVNHLCAKGFWSNPQLWTAQFT